MHLVMEFIIIKATGMKGVFTPFYFFFFFFLGIFFGTDSEGSFYTEKKLFFSVCVGKSPIFCGW
jgi:hypothetical protein